MEGFMTPGDKLLALKDDLYTMICSRFAAAEIDISTGVLVLDAIKADLREMSMNSMMRRVDGLLAEREKEKNAV